MLYKTHRRAGLSGRSLFRTIRQRKVAGDVSEVVPQPFNDLVRVRPESLWLILRHAWGSHPRHGSGCPCPRWSQERLRRGKGRCRRGDGFLKVDEERVKKGVEGVGEGRAAVVSEIFVARQSVRGIEREHTCHE